ncbi:uncharacterized protein LOC117652959 isoform X2 [Thrips palmi]|nr:uncharacterized protein LOC117652959 isoform X2 [Thrips palmi]
MAPKAYTWFTITCIVEGLKNIPPELHPVVDHYYVTCFLWPTERLVIPDQRVVRDLGQLLASQNLLIIKDDVPRSLRRGYLESVWRSRHHLKRLTLVLDNTTKTDLGHSSVYVLSQLHCLEQLSVYVEHDFVYEKGQLQQLFPNLVELEVVEKGTCSKQYDLFKDLLVDGLVSAKFRPGLIARPDLITALERCQKLTHLDMHWDYAPVFPSLPALESVYARLTLDNPVLDEIEQSVASACTPTLRYLHLIVMCKICPVCHRTVSHDCGRGVKAVSTLRRTGWVTFFVCRQFGQNPSEVTVC